MEWLSHNLPFVLAVAGIIGTWAVMGWRIKRLEVIAVQFQLHAANTSLHIDPARDKAIWDDFQDGVRREFDGVNRKLDKLMLVQPTPPI